MDKRNPCLSLKHHGIRGKICSDFLTVPVYDCAGCAVTLRVGELEPGCYDYGYAVHLPDGQTFNKIPGQGSGWFDSRTNALLYGAHAIRLAFASVLPPEAHGALLDKITVYLSPTLFDA